MQDEPGGSGKAAAGAPAVLDRLMPLVYQELRRLARIHLRHERPDHTLQPTALVHEVYVRMARQRRLEGVTGTHFLALASNMMRRVLLDSAAQRHARKRFSSSSRVPLEDRLGATGRAEVELIDLDRALSELARLDPRQARLLELRFFGGLTIAETAEVMGIATATVEREWATARLWLARRLDRGAAP